MNPTAMDPIRMRMPSGTVSSDQEMNLLSAVAEKHFVFIIGAPRSGTTWLHAMLAHHPKVAATPEVEQTFFDRYLTKLTRAWEVECQNRDQGRWIQGLPYLWSEEEFYKFVTDFFQRVYVKILEKNPDASHILDKHPNYSNYVDLIIKVVPEAKFVHIIRDGRDVVASMISASRRLGFGSDDIEVATRKWVEHTANARKAETIDRGNYYEIKYEDLLRQGKDRLLDIFEFCGLPTDESLIESIDDRKKYSSPNPDVDSSGEKIQPAWQTALSQHQKFIFNKVGGDFLKRLNYASDDQWVFPDRFARLRLYTGLYFRGIIRRFRRAGSVLLKGSS